MQPPAAVEPVREDPPKTDDTAETETGAETPQETPEALTGTGAPAAADDATDDELERALAEMRGDA